MLIGLHGKKQAGKDTVHRRIEKLLGPGSITGATVERVSFADLLYESAAAALGVTADDLQRWKSEPDARVTFAVPGRSRDLVRAQKSQTVREYLQRYGTEAHRNVFGDNFWVDSVDLRDHERKIVVVTDVRFQNEAQAVIDAGGHVVHVIGPLDVESAGDGHASEKTLPAFLVDDLIDNSVRDDNFCHLDTQVLDLALRLLREERVA